MKMRPFDKQSSSSLPRERPCLETPAMTGYRAGMSSTGVIGQKLGIMYEVEQDLPRAFDTAIQAVRRQFGGKR